MKAKLIQIFLGAIGSAITVLVTHFTSTPADVATGVAALAGPATTLAGVKIQMLLSAMRA